MNSPIAKYLWQNEPWAKYVPSELMESLCNIEHDDRKPPTLEKAVAEAKYIIGLHYEGGTASSDMLSGEDGEESRQQALQTIKECKAFIKRYDPASVPAKRAKRVRQPVKARRSATQTPAP